MKAIVIPTYKERDTLAENLKKINNLLTDDDVILLIDDTKDFETKNARQLASRVRVLPIVKKKRGYGQSLKTGLMIATFILEADYIIQMDADHNPKDLNKLFKPLPMKEDFVIGYEPKRKRRLARMITNFLSRRIGLHYEHPTCGFRLFKNQVLRQLEWRKIKSKGFDVQIEILYQLQQKRFKGLEVEISHTRREYDKSKMGLRQVYKHLQMFRRLFTKHLYISFIQLFSGDRQHE